MVRINFGASNYVRNAPGVPLEDTIMEIPDFGNLEEAPEYLSLELKLEGNTPKRTEMHGFPAVSLQKGGRTPGDVWMLWIESRKEWVTIYHSNWLESDAWGDDDSYRGPFKSEVSQGMKILEAYEISTEKLPLEKILYTGPDELEKLAIKKI